MPRTAKTTTAPAKFRTPNDMSDFDPFLDEDLPDDTPVPTATDSQECEPAQLQGVNFTILDIAEEPLEDQTYQLFKWRIFVQLRQTGAKTSFLINPSKRRYGLLEQLAQELPVRNMTLVQKSFIEQKKYKLIKYYELANYTEHSGTISH